MAAAQRNADMYVLDTVADDIEGFDDVMRRLNDENSGWTAEWNGRFERQEVVAALSRLIRDGSVEAYAFSSINKSLVKQAHGSLPPADYADAWYGIAARGRMRHRNWDDADDIL